MPKKLTNNLWFFLEELNPMTDDQTKPEKSIEHYQAQFCQLLGCLPLAMAIAVIIWALSQFWPGY